MSEETQIPAAPGVAGVDYCPHGPACSSQSECFRRVIGEQPAAPGVWSVTESVMEIAKSAKRIADALESIDRTLDCIDGVIGRYIRE